MPTSVNSDPYPSSNRISELIIINLVANLGPVHDGNDLSLQME